MEKNSKNRHLPAGRAAFYGAFLGLALILSYVESMIPFFFGVPGMKLGLCNVLVVFLLYRYGAKDALILNVARILLAGFLFGNAFSIIYSLAGGVISWAVMCLLKKTGRFSVAGVSVAGGFAHNMGQLAVAAVVVENYYVFFYGPVLAAAGVVTGILIGILAGEMLSRIPEI